MADHPEFIFKELFLLRGVYFHASLMFVFASDGETEREQLKSAFRNSPETANGCWGLVQYPASL